CTSPQPTSLFSLSLHDSVPLPTIHSFPTRRSSDLYESRLDFAYFTEFDMPTLLERLKHLPSHTIVYHTSIMRDAAGNHFVDATRSEEHTSELQSPYDLVCRLLLEKKKKKKIKTPQI